MNMDDSFRNIDHTLILFIVHSQLICCMRSSMVKVSSTRDAIYIFGFLKSKDELKNNINKYQDKCNSKLLHDAS